MYLSNHAIERCNQRGIPEAMIDVIFKFGATDHHKGREILFLDKKGRKKAKHYLGNLYSGSESVLKDTFIVVGDGTVVTAARKAVHYKRQRR